MAHPLVWPSKYFFYPIGNTAAVCLTRDLSPEEPAHILSLGCGDPRNVLYTIFSEPQQMGRSLDFTCCDFDPGVLARNVLLFTMIADNQSYTTTVWNTFFHMYLDAASHTSLIEQCKKLVDHSQTLQLWNASPYGAFLKMCTEYTLVELRRHWLLYIEMQNLPSKRKKVIIDAFKVMSKSSSQGAETLSRPALRSSGPLLVQAVKVCTDQFRQYWKTGTTFSNPKQSLAAIILNPTFVYSRGGEGCSVHYGSDPIVPFHIAPVFGNAKRSITVADVVKAAQSEFSLWCTAFHISLPTSNPNSDSPIIRFFLSEATTACSALRSFSTTGTVKFNLPVSQWKTQLIQLNSDDYVSGHAPASFNVIDTSNLSDHIGLLNVLVATVPLLTPAPETSVLYTESLIYSGLDATKEIVRTLYADVTVLGLLIGICPVDYLSGFTTRSHTHELMLLASVDGPAPQYHQVITWKPPGSGDAIVGQAGHPYVVPTFDPYQLGTFFYDMYHRLFEEEDSHHFQRINQDNIERASGMSNMAHYTREGFVLFLKLVKDKNQIPEEQWMRVIDRFFSIQLADRSLPMDTLAINDLHAHMYRQGVYTVPHFYMNEPKVGRFSHWEAITPIVRVVLTIPRAKLAVLNNPTVPTPTMICLVEGPRSMNVFGSVHVAYGRALPMGTKDKPWVMFEEDSEGWAGTMPLVASFTMPTWLLTGREPMKDLKVAVAVRSTPLTAQLVRKLGLSLQVFAAPLLDEFQVQILPEYPLPTKKLATSPPLSVPGLVAIGPASATSVELDEECELVTSLVSRISVVNEDAKLLFQNKAVPEIAQVSPCVMGLRIGGHFQHVIFPFPVIGSQYRLRLARKSLYIEIIVPVFAPLKNEGMKLNPFPVVGLNQAMTPWSIHRINLSRLPILDNKVKDIGRWLDPHFGSMMSSRERSLRKKQGNDILMSVKDTIHSILVRAAGIQHGPPKRLFGLSYGEGRGNCDTILFIKDVKFDLHSHTMVCDGYVLPLTKRFIGRMQTPFHRLVSSGNLTTIPIVAAEVQAWKSLLPALVERCRTSWKHKITCEYKIEGRIPLTEVMEIDPLCSCGQGKDTNDMLKVELWSKFAPHATRFALSPLFAVSYLEPIGRDPTRYRCSVCRGKGNPKLLKCTSCKKTRYCSKECQKKDWKLHRMRCESN